MSKIALIAVLLLSGCDGRNYDCRMLHGGWHPDVPLEVQKLCREQRP